jgi:hypothetical protein
MTALRLDLSSPPSPADSGTPRSNGNPTNAAPELVPVEGAGSSQNPLDAFESEGPATAPPGAPSTLVQTPQQWEEPSYKSDRQPTTKWSFIKWLVSGLSALLVIAIAGVPVGRAWMRDPALPLAARPGLVSVETDPAGVEVFLDGHLAGRTPVRLAVPGGHGIIELRHNGLVRTLPVSTAPGSTVSHFYEFVSVPPAEISVPAPKPPAPAATAPAALTAADAAFQLLVGTVDGRQ